MILLLALTGCVTEIPSNDGPFEPAIVYVSGRFAVDPDRGAVPYVQAGETVPVTVDFTIADQRFFDTAAEQHLCRLSLTTLDAVPAAEWLSDADATFAFEMPASAEVTGTCPAYDVDVWGDLEGSITGPPVGLGLGELDADVEARVRGDVIAQGGNYSRDVQPFAAGAGFYWAPLEEERPAGYAANNQARGFLLDDDGERTDTVLDAEAALEDPPLEAAWEVGLVFGVDATFIPR